MAITKSSWLIGGGYLTEEELEEEFEVLREYQVVIDPKPEIEPDEE